MSLDQRLTSPAREILAYLLRQPQTQHSMDRIQWAVLPFCVGNLATKIAVTVEELVESGYLEREPESSDDAEHKVFYHVSSRYLSAFQQRQPLNSVPDEDE